MSGVVSGPHEWLGNTADEWLRFALLALFATALLTLLKHQAIQRLRRAAQRTATTIDDLLIQVLSKTRTTLLAVGALYVAAQSLSLPASVDRVLDGLVTAALLLQFGLWANEAIAVWVGRYRARASSLGASGTAVVSLIGRVVVWSIILLLLLENAGIDITAMVAGLGIGGVAVALAVQNILGDLFASFSIIVDRPFEVGDFIIVDDYMGSVENIGLKTTRLRSLGGEQIIFANSDLLQTRVRNYKRMQERRAVFTFRLTQQTSPEELEWAALQVREIVHNARNVHLERAHFFKFSDYAFDYEVAYWIASPDYNEYMDLQQSINLQIIRAFAARGVKFAVPTQRVCLQPMEDSVIEENVNIAKVCTRSTDRGSADSH